MNQSGNFANTMAAWAAGEPSVKALVLFGSQVRAKGDLVWSADAQSDWDFQIITSHPQMFLDSKWLLEFTNIKLRAYAVRVPRIGAMPKINAVLSETEADFVIIPACTLRWANFAVKLGLHNKIGRLVRSLQDLSIVIRPGFRFLKGGETWEPFYNRVINEVPDPRLDDAQIRNLAEGFVCDYFWTLRKLERGELVAVQRVLHRELAETNYRLLHELKLRQNERSFPDARRLERVTTTKELLSVSVHTSPQVMLLRSALEQCATTLRILVSSLLGTAWHWPDI